MGDEVAEERATYEGTFDLPQFGLRRRWLEGSALPPEWEPQILSLLEVGFNGGPRWFDLAVPREEHLRWKYSDFPAGTNVIVTLDEDEQIVDFYSQFRRTWLVRGRRYVGTDGVDVVRSPEWQGRGLQRAYSAHPDATLHPDVHFNFTSVTHPAHRHQAEERGSKTPGNPSQDLLRPISPWRLALSRAFGARSGPGASGPSATRAAVMARESTTGSRLRRLGGLGARYAVSAARRRPPRAGRDLEIATVERFDERFSAMLERAMEQFDLVQERTLAFLNWRFCDRRAGPFVVRVATEDGAVVGFAVTRASVPESAIAEILALPGRLDVAEALIADAVGLASSRGANVVRCRLAERHPYWPVLERAGFFPIGRVAGELFDPRAGDLEDFAAVERPDARCHFTLADTDFV